MGVKNLQQRIGEVSAYLQALLNPNIFPSVQEAVEKKDEAILIKACKRAKIPDGYISSIVPIVLSATPKKWPDYF